MQKIVKSVKIWQSYREYKGGNFFETQFRLPFTCDIKAISGWEMGKCSVFIPSHSHQAIPVLFLVSPELQ